MEKVARSEPHVLIVGGGFAGVNAAIALEGSLPRHFPVRITLVSKENFFLFTPFLAEVAASFIETRHAVVPIRRMVRRAQFIEGEAIGFDIPGHTARVRDQSGAVSEVSFDHLVVAPGGEPDYFGLPGVPEHALNMKTVADAMYVRNWVIDLLEQADVMLPDERRDRLTFVVVGGGLAGIEVVGELQDFVLQALRDYRNVGAEEVKMILIEALDRLAAELPGNLGSYARKHLEQRGIEVLLRTTVVAADDRGVILGDGRRVDTRTIIWTAGARASSLTNQLPVERDGKGRLAVNEYLQLPAWPYVWVLGDAARVRDPDSGGFQPPTAQHALRQGRYAGRSIAAVLRDRPLKRYSFRGLGMLAALGRHKGVGLILGLRVTGFLAWFLWRTYYLLQLPRWEKRTRVALDWALDLIFPPDIVQLKVRERKE